MTVAHWEIPLNGKPVNIEVDHNYFSGKRVIRVNQNIAYEGTKFLDFGSEHSFQVGDTLFQVKIKTSNWPVKYELLINGRSQGEQFVPIPRWAWLYLLPVIIFIPLSGGNGVIPAAIRGGIVGAGFGIAFVLASMPSIKPIVRFILGLIIMAIVCGIVLIMRS